MFRRWIGTVLGIVVMYAPALVHAENYAAFAVGPNVATLDTTDAGKLDLKLPT